MTLGSLTLLELPTLSLDSRIQLSPLKPLSSHIRLIKINPFDMSQWQKRRNFMGAHSLFLDASDDYFWDELLWAELLTKTLQAKPQKVGIALFIGNMTIQPHNEPLFTDPRLVWAIPKRAEANQLPSFTLFDRSNVGELNLNEDSDGVFRRYIPSKSDLGDFFYRLTGINPYPFSKMKFPLPEKDLPIVDAHLILDENPEVLADLKGKIVVFGRSFQESNLTFSTPLGAFSKLGISGLILHHFLENSWIKVTSSWFYLLYFACLAFLIIWLMSRYPHKVALVLLTFLGLVLTLISIYFFDTHHIWIPITGVWVQLITTWILFLGYALNRMEQKTLRLKEEKKLHHELEELKINFVSLISHDLKTPIAKIRAVVSRLQEEIVKPEHLYEIKKIEKYSQDLNRYIHNVLKLLQVESSEFKLRIDSVDIQSLIEDLLLELDPFLKEKSITVTTDIAPLFPIDGDPHLIKEILLNLLQNAIQYSPKQSQIHIHVVDQNHFVKIKISDQGPGIPAEEIPFLFDKFYRGKNSSISQQGSGLGLYLVKYFIELHEGRIHIISKLGVGTRVITWLPLEQKNVSPSQKNSVDDSINGSSDDSTNYYHGSSSRGDSVDRL
jgi:two-component system, OmpR family, phosphate regulon sensor histidine kinase PhoR